MKKFAQKTAEVKLLVGIIWIGMLILYMLSKTILGTYQVSFLTIIELALVATVIGGIKILYDSKFILKTHKMGMIIFERYFLITLIMVGFNQIFTFYHLTGIEYLYFVLLITFSYFGALVGFYVMDLLDVNILNTKLNKYNQSNKED